MLLSYFIDDLGGPPVDRIPATERYRGGPRWSGGPFHHLRLRNFLAALAGQIRHRNRATRLDYLHDLEARGRKWSKRVAYLMTDPGQAVTARHVAWLNAHLLRIRGLCADHRASLVVAYLPDVSQLHHPHLQHINRVLADVTKALDIPFVDTTPALEQDSDVRRYYLWPVDAHTNSAGHDLIARTLEPVVCDVLRKRGIPCRVPAATGNPRRFHATPPSVSHRTEGLL